MSFTDLTPASGRQDHTTSPSARLRSRQSRNSRPSHPSPTFVTIAKRPSVWAGTARDMQVIWVKREREYFCCRDWTGRNSVNCFSKSGFAARPRRRDHHAYRALAGVRARHIGELALEGGRTGPAVQPFLFQCGGDERGVGSLRRAVDDELAPGSDWKVAAIDRSGS